MLNSSRLRRLLPTGVRCVTIPSTVKASGSFLTEESNGGRVRVRYGRWDRPSPPGKQMSTCNTILVGRVKGGWESERGLRTLNFEL